MRMVFTRIAGGECVATIYRRDGVVVQLPSYSRKHRVPHDLAHAVVERELGIAGGIFGTLAAGGLFANARVIAGRPRPDAARRSDRVLRANGPEIGVSELVSGVLQDVVEHGRTGDAAARVRQAWSVVPDLPPYPDGRVRAAAAVLDDLGRQWQTVAPGGTLEFFWPDRLVREVPRPDAKPRPDAEPHRDPTRRARAATR